MSIPLVITFAFESGRLNKLIFYQQMLQLLLISIAIYTYIDTFADGLFDDIDETYLCTVNNFSLNFFYKLQLK